MNVQRVRPRDSVAIRLLATDRKRARLIDDMPNALDVYVSSECPNCGEAARLAEEAAVRYPDVVVRVIDLDQLDGNPPPDPVVAVPTYLLNGRVVSLGNPYPEDLFARLHEAGE
jgi:alkyl hydroperoxide reductase subunit AhpF